MLDGYSIALTLNLQTSAAKVFLEAHLGFRTPEQIMKKERKRQDLLMKSLLVSSSSLDLKIFRVSSVNMRKGFDHLKKLREWVVDDRVREICFVFNDVKLHFGLEDVWHITRLPVDGEAVTEVEGNPFQLSVEYLGENLCKGKRGAIKLSTLKNRFQNVPVEIDSSELTYYIRAFLLYVLGTAILLDKWGSLVPTIYLPLLEDIEKLRYCNPTLDQFFDML
ncbi:hypothetical protein RHGRI_003374 [Rhododendron griersonianum]|uniref:Uncharacterized protein n=1 Tax=Rhododendron griersonianum TaxID=479676 RepID=A0AAV6L596_9ERIC|nr:hypothetical protein RHGRI_003374 [Rhododendron griersonianum]